MHRLAMPTITLVAGIGAVGGVAAGAALGAVGGPPGMLVGATIGEVLDGMAGHGVAELNDPAVEDSYWRENYRNEPSANRNFNYDEYESAYRTGYTCYDKHAEKRWDDVEADLQHDWEQSKGKASLAWSDAKPATQAAWHRVERGLPGDADGDGLQSLRAFKPETRERQGTRVFLSEELCPSRNHRQHPANDSSKNGKSNPRMAGPVWLRTMIQTPIHAIHWILKQPETARTGRTNGA